MQRVDEVFSTDRASLTRVPLELRRERRHLQRAQAAGRAAQAVRRLPQSIAIAGLSCLAKRLDSRGRFDAEFRDHASQRTSIAHARAVQLPPQLGQGGPVDDRWQNLGGPAGHTGRQPAPQRCLERLEPQRLGQVVVHAGGQTPIAVTPHRAGGQGDDRQCAVTGVALAYRGGGLEPVHLWHLAVHQDDGIWRIVHVHVEDVQCLAAVGGDIHLHPQVAQHGRGHLAVHRHVLDEQHARGPRRGRRMRSNTVHSDCGRDSSRSGSHNGEIHFLRNILSPDAGAARQFLQ